MNSIGYGLILLGALLFVIGSVGLIRFPDLYCRLHALTKVDNLGTGVLLLGVGLLEGSWFTAVKLALIWVCVLISSGAIAHLIAMYGLRTEGH